ncbi:MAG: OmpA family protein [Bdellovibrionales bacterium]
MNKVSVSLVALTAALLLAPDAAQAKTTSGWYVALGVGVVFPQDPTIYAGGVKRKGTDENNAFAFSKNVGYAFANGFRLELEGYKNQINTETFNNATGFGHMTNRILFANALYDFNNNSIFTPYIGAGFGADWVDVKNVGSAAARLDGDKIVGAYQAIVGAAAQLDANWALTADYRYVASFDPKVSYTGGTKGRISNASQNFIVGVRYSFGADKPVAQPARAEAPVIKPRKAVKAVVAPVGQNFTVFFDFDKSTLTSEAKGIIAAAAKEFEKGGFAIIVVTGHTDTMGTEGYNNKLSVRRALAVKAELASLGVAAANIKDAGVGEGGLLVPTTEDVREAQNRRAEIVLSK